MATDLGTVSRRGRGDSSKIYGKKNEAVQNICRKTDEQTWGKIDISGSDKTVPKKDEG